MYQLQGQFNSQEFKVDGSCELAVAPRAVGLVVLRCEESEANLRMGVGEGAGAHLIVPKVSRSCQLTVTVAAGAQFTLSVLGILASEHEVNINIELAGQGANVHAQLPFVGLGVGRARITCALAHMAPQTRGRIMARRVQRGSSVSELVGCLLIAPGAKGTDTYLSDKAVLIGGQAKAVSKPELEILAHDIKASHGATVGQLNPDEVFYLCSRGLTPQAAEELLVGAFLKPALVGVPLELVEGLYKELRITN